MFNERFLLLCPFFHPEPLGMGKYNSFLAKKLADIGVPVDVICFHPLYPDWRSRRSQECLKGVKILRGGAWIRYPGLSLLRRAMLEFGFLIYVLRHAGRIKNYSKIVVVMPPMLFLPLVRLAARPGARITAIVHDLQGIMAGVGTNRWRQKLVRPLRFLEAMMLRFCHRVIVLSNEMASFVIESYKIPSSRIAVCWPFVTIEKRVSGTMLTGMFDQDKKHIVYAGALGEKQNPQGLVGFFLALLDHRQDVVCHVFSGGPIFERLRKALRLQNPRLVFHDLIAERDLPELYQRSCIQLIPERIGFSNGAFPSKLPNLLASGVPILYIGHKNSDVRHIIEGANAGLCSDSWDLGKLIMLTDRLLSESDRRSIAERRMVFDWKYRKAMNVDVVIGELSEMLN